MANLKSRVSGFISGAKANGTNGLRIVLDALEHWEQHNAPVHFLRLVEGVVETDAKAFKAIARYVTQSEGGNASGSLPAKPKDGDTILLRPDRMDELRALADEGLSFRGFKVAKSRAEYELKRAAMSYARGGIKNGHGKAAVKAALEAALKELGE